MIESLIFLAVAVFIAKHLLARGQTLVGLLAAVVAGAFALHIVFLAITFISAPLGYLFAHAVLLILALAAAAFVAVTVGRLLHRS